VDGTIVDEVRGDAGSGLLVLMQTTLNLMPSLLRAPAIWRGLLQFRQVHWHRCGGFLLGNCGDLLNVSFSERCVQLAQLNDPTAHGLQNAILIPCVKHDTIFHPVPFGH
jgi:hypothetical protein